MSSALLYLRKENGEVGLAILLKPEGHLLSGKEKRVVDQWEENRVYRKPAEEGIAIKAA